MHPILFEIRGFPVYTYGVLLAAAYLLGLQFALMRGRQRGLDPNRIMDLGIWIIISAVAVALWYLKRHKMPMWTVTDVFAPGIALGHVVGRLGCLFAGCCFGRRTAVPWAITFHSEFAAQNVGTPLEVPLHPTQIYEEIGRAHV